MGKCCMAVLYVFSSIKDPFTLLLPCKQCEQRKAKRTIQRLIRRVCLPYEYME